jgi:hypothetical protein
MPKKLKNTTRLKTYKKEEDDGANSTGKQMVDPQTVKSDDTGSNKSKLNSNFISPSSILIFLGTRYAFLRSFECFSKSFFKFEDF